MYALRLCDFRLEYRLTVASPLHVGGKQDDPNGGATTQLSGRRSRGDGKGRGADYRVTLEAGVRGDSESGVTLPLHEVSEDGTAMTLFVPGTSIRGALRHMLWRRLDRALGNAEMDSAYTRDHASGDRTVDRRYGEPDSEIYWSPRFGNVLVRHLFGSEARRGAVAFSRASVVPRAPAVKAQSRYSNLQNDIGGRSQPNADLRILTHNRLDRFTMASTEGLRNLAAIETGTKLDGAVTIANFAWWQVGALYLAMNALNAGALRLGTRGAVGLGRVAIEPVRVVLSWHPVVAPAIGELMPGIGRCLESESLQFIRRDRELASQILGNVEGTDQKAIQMFVHDKEDALDGAAAGLPPETHDARSFRRLRTWSDKNACEALMKHATKRLAAVARGLGARQELSNA